MNLQTDKWPFRPKPWFQGFQGKLSPKFTKQAWVRNRILGGFFFKQALMQGSQRAWLSYVEAMESGSPDYEWIDACLEPSGCECILIQICDAALCRYLFGLMSDGSQHYLSRAYQQAQADFAAVQKCDARFLRDTQSSYRHCLCEKCISI